eukprot:TRINITY_DN61817_c0_g1_i1.p1 TRINITY_DN61817_c0_g1~~TRINITY_DN61817_c0_g1_i1.p1  ORF type:complete len:551 (+),score=77.36 TRINITY_DN61817_c0_g1_i1:142-1794(+)
MAQASQRAELRFKVGDRVACNMGQEGWARGFVVQLHYRQQNWPKGKIVPYQVQLDHTLEDGLIFAPVDLPHIIRAEANAPVGTPSVPADGEPEIALRSIQMELEAVRALPFVLHVDTPQVMGIAESEGELITPSCGTGPWFVAVSLRVADKGEYAGRFELRFKINASWPRSPSEVRFCSLIHHVLVDDDGSIDPAVLMDAEEMIIPRKEATINSLCTTLRAVQLLLSDPSRILGKSYGDMVDQERIMQRKRVHVISSYERQQLHRALFDAERGWVCEWFDPVFWEAHMNGTESAWKGLMKEEALDIYSFPLFTTAFCDMFIEEMDNFQASGLPAMRPNNMNNYGVIVNQIGMEQILDKLQQEFLQPLAKVLFPGIGSYLDGHHSFIVRYKVGEDLGLDIHTDDSDVTFNVCLGRDFTGAGLRFCGNQGSAHHRHSSALYFHRKGRCVVHLGHRRHGADDITAGERLNLIMWSRNSEYRRSNGYRRHNMQSRGTGYEREDGPPDKVCVSFTHDRDYGVFADYTAKTEQHKGQGWCPPRHAEYEGFKRETDT